MRGEDLTRYWEELGALEGRRNAMGRRLHNDFSSVTRAKKGRRPRRDGQALSFLTSQLLPSFSLVAPTACRTAATFSSRPPWDGRPRRKERRNAGDVVWLCSRRSAQTTAVYNKRRKWAEFRPRERYGHLQLGSGSVTSLSGTLQGRTSEDHARQHGCHQVMSTTVSSLLGHGIIHIFACEIPRPPSHRGDPAALLAA